MEYINIGVIGTRKRNTHSDFLKVQASVMKLVNKYQYSYKIKLISGGCEKGGDKMAEVIAKKYGIPITIFYPNKRQHKFPDALFIRNTEIAEKSDCIIACVVNPKDNLDDILNRKKGGTEDTLRKFKKFNPVGCDESDEIFGDIIII